MKIKENVYQIGKKYYKKFPIIRGIYLNIQPIYGRTIYRVLNKKREPTIENLEFNTKYFARSYGLRQAFYFETITNYSQDTDFRSKIGVNIEYLPLWHLAAIDFLRNNIPTDAKILDLCCGLGHFFIFLKELGFFKFAGVDDSTFQPGIIKAAKKFLDYYGINARFYDFNISYPWNYNELYEEKFNVVTHFGVGTYYLFEIVYKLLKPRGYFIFETVEKEFGGVWTEDFEFVKVYEGFGREKGGHDKSTHQYNTMVLRKK